MVKRELTIRQKQVLRAITNGKSYKEIGIENQRGKQSKST
jgi:DNA-binding CsgD family transcriptional regulator